MNNNRVSYAEVVWEITCLLQEAESLEDALRAGLESVVRAVEAEAGTIWFYNAAGDKRIYPSFWIGGADLSGLSLACGEGIAGGVVKDAKTTVVKDCQSDERWAGRFDAATGFVTRSMICVPLTNKYETVGCIQIINKTDGSLYTDDDVSLCETLAMLTAIAIDNKGLNLGFTESKPPLISLKNVSKTLTSGDVEQKLLRDVTFDILEGELLVLLGETGSGKDALYDILVGLDSATDGCVTLDGKESPLAGADPLASFRRSSVGVIRGDSGLLPELTLKQNLALIGGLVKKPLKVSEALERVGLTGFESKYPSELTPRERQLAALACAAVKRPKLILADEPTAALDFESGAEVLSALEALRAENTLLIVTRNEEIAKLADRVIRIKAGAVAEVVANAHPASAKELVW